MNDVIVIPEFFIIKFVITHLALSYISEILTFSNSLTSLKGPICLRLAIIFILKKLFLVSGYSFQIFSYLPYR
jgi:hypothetical protein